MSVGKHKTIHFAITSSKYCTHRRMGLEILGGRTRICPTRAEGARTSRGVRGHAHQENFEKKSLFNAISWVLVWVFMHGASDK